MAENKVYLAIGEETARGTAESTTVGFVPLAAMPKIKPTFKDEPRKEVRGEDSIKGMHALRRMSSAWETSLEIPAYTEAGTVAGIIGTLLKFAFGKVNSAQNGATGQYYHMMYPVPDPFGTGSIGDNGLTLNENFNEAATVVNFPWVGGRVKGLTFTQEPGQQLKIAVDMFGQYLNTIGAAIATPVFPAENLRLDYNMLTVYTGTITRTGTGPDFTAFAFGSATTLKPDKITVKFENGQSDKLRLAGVTYPDKTTLQGVYKVTVDIEIDFEAPGSGFDSSDEYRAYLAGLAETNLFLHWDTGVDAGTGDHHSLYIDLPRLRRSGAEKEFDLEKDPMAKLTYEGLYDSTTCKYIMGLMLKNTASAV